MANKKQKVYVVDDLTNKTVVDVIYRNIIESSFEEYVSYKNKEYIITRDYNNDRFISLEEKITPIGTFQPVTQKKKLTSINQKISKGLFN